MRDMKNLLNIQLKIMKELQLDEKKINEKIQKEKSISVAFFSKFS